VRSERKKMRYFAVILGLSSIIFSQVQAVEVCMVGGCYETSAPGFPAIVSKHPLGYTGALQEDLAPACIDPADVIRIAALVNKNLMDEARVLFNQKNCRKLHTGDMVTVAKRVTVEGLTMICLQPNGGSHCYWTNDGWKF